MEAFLFPLGLLCFAAFIGGIVSFFSLFSADKESRIKTLEREMECLQLELTKIVTRLTRIQHDLDNPNIFDSASKKTVPEQAVSEPPSPVSIKPLMIHPSVSSEVLQEVDVISDDDLTQQALAENQQEPQTPPVEPTPQRTKATEVHNSKTTFKPVAPIAPNSLEKGFLVAKNWLLGGNTLVRSGIVILFIGISFLLKYAAEHSQVSIEFRLLGIVLSGIGLMVLGWRLRASRPEYSWALQGGGIGMMYLTIFAALRLYQLILPSLAFGLLIAVALLSAAIAVLQSAMSLAILGFTGGFLAPILTASGSGNHVSLFSFYLVLNLAIAFVAFHKSWRPLNVLGFAFTFIIGTLWGAKSYTPAYFATTEPFLVIHFVLFTFIAVLYALRQATKASDYVDATLVFGTPLVGFSLQYALLRDSPFGLAYSALALGIFYIGLAWWVLTRQRDTLKFLGECFLALGVGFLTLTLPLALDGRWTSAAWAVEGVGLLWVGLRQSRQLPAFTGLVLQLLAALAFSKGWGLTGYADVGHQNMCLGVGFIALSGWACGALLNANKSSRFNFLAMPLAFWGWAWWVGAGLTAIDEFLPSEVYVHAGLIFVALTSVALPEVAKWLRWPKLASLSVLLLPAMAITLVHDEAHESYPFAHQGALAWLLAYAVYIVNLQHDYIPQGARYRAPLVWIAALIVGWVWRYQFHWLVNESLIWHQIGLAIAPLLLIAGITQWLIRDRNAIMASGAVRTWGWLGCAPLAVFLVAWFMEASFALDGDAAPLPYLPLINPLDITLSAILLVLLIWQRDMAKTFNPLKNHMPALAGIMGFTLINGMLLRTLHHWAGIPFRWGAIFDTPLVQMSFTFLWAVVAFILMLLAHKRVLRQLWIIGASLMGLVVAKIFLFDMAQSGSIERIASFIGAGLMLLVMGYFAPLPPTNKFATERQKS